jgi:hypothetical protein
MHPAEASAEPVRSQLEKILASPEFLRNDRLSKFLRFVVEQQLAGKAAELKESLVAIEVFGRMPGFDPRQDSVVRTEASTLRARLGTLRRRRRRDPVVIELPKGGYSPVFRQPEAAGRDVPGPEGRPSAAPNTAVAHDHAGWPRVGSGSERLVVGAAQKRAYCDRGSAVE